jgi:predicted DNA-binding transcriptional regulator YafY
VLVHAPADELAARLTPAVGRVEPRDAGSCVLHTGADSLDGLAGNLGLLGADFEVTEPPELVEKVALLARRYRLAVARSEPR